jgi:hypothetical protein
MVKIAARLFAVLLVMSCGAIAALACACSGSTLGSFCVGAKCPGGHGHAVDCQDCCDTGCVLSNCGTQLCVNQCLTACYSACDTKCSS